MAEKSLVRRIHDATCPGAVANVKPVQKVCPVCRSAASEDPDSTD
jgi:hypothetical protein